MYNRILPCHSHAKYDDMFKLIAQPDYPMNV